ncbi:MFS transporter [Microbacteriaceae bacterium VKM Ac-2855]|nr:MFS transporter [Microbacteriaceae bacterium VKM Ac-2855]
MTTAGITTHPPLASVAAPDRRRTVPHGAGFWVIAAAFLAVMAFSTIPTPLYALYQQRDGFPTYVITVVFAAYAVGVVASLFLAGHVSDWLGRRRIILAAVLIELLSAVVFLLWPEVPGLLLARFISGVGAGAITATATAHLSELRAIARPDEGPAFSRVVSTLVNMGGLALGPLLAGILAVTVTDPLTVPYAVFVVALLVAAIAVVFVPETVERREELPAYRPQRVSVPAASRSAFWSAAAGAFAGFAIFGLFTSLAPSFIAGSLHESSRLLAGAVSFGVFAAAAVAQIVFARVPTRRGLVIAILAMVVGLVAFAAGVVGVSLPLFVIGGVVAGAGVGVLFRVSLAIAGSLASPETRGEVLAAMFLAAYVGLALPVLLLGIALAFLPVVPVLLAFVAIVIVMVVVAGRAMRARA